MEDKIRELLQANFKDAIVEEDHFRDQFSIYINKESLYDICTALLHDNELEFNLLTDICSLDWLGNPEEAKGRFEVIYNLYSIKNKYRFFLKVRLSEKDAEIDSVSSLWHTADWLEREVYDLFGIEFTGHPDLRKIVTPDDLKGHPLRKDFPLTYEVPRFSYNKNEPPEVIT